MAAELTIRRWTRGQQDRLYVNTATGAQVGWRDLRTGQDHLALPELRPDFLAAVDRWQLSHRAGTSPAPNDVRQPIHTRRPDGPPAAEPAATPSRARRPDLADRQAGAGLTARAERLQIQNTFLRWLARVLGVRGRDQPWQLGAAGEIAVGRKIDRLRRRGCYVLHSITLGHGGDVDHLVISRYGVFSINTKHHRRAVITVNSSAVVVQKRTRPYPQAARREAERVKTALSAALGRPIHVAPLVVVHGHARLRGWIRHQPLGVQVLPSWAATWWFRSPGRAILDQSDVEEVYAAARRPAVWRSV